MRQKVHLAAVQDLSKAISLASVKEKPIIQSILDKAQKALEEDNKIQAKVRY